MDTSNRGVNYAVVNELRQCQTGYKKGVHGMATLFFWRSGPMTSFTWTNSPTVRVPGRRSRNTQRGPRRLILYQNLWLTKCLHVH